MKKSQAYTFIILSCLLFGTQGIFQKWLVPFGFTAMQMTAMRGIVSAVAMSLFVLFTKKNLFKTDLKSLGIFAIAGVFMFLCAFFYYAAMDHVSNATAVVLMYTSPIYVLLFSVLFLKEKLTVIKGIAVAMMLVGAALVSGIVGGMDFNFWGVLFAILAGVTYAAYNIVAKIEMKRGNDPMTAMIYCYIVMGLLSGLCADVPSMVSLTAQDPGIILLLIFGIGLVTCAIPYLIYTISLKAVPAGTASALGLLEPMAAIVYGIVFFREQPSMPVIIGMALILGAVFTLSRIKE